MSLKCLDMWKGTSGNGKRRGKQGVWGEFVGGNQCDNLLLGEPPPTHTDTTNNTHTHSLCQTLRSGREKRYHATHVNKQKMLGGGFRVWAGLGGVGEKNVKTVITLQNTVRRLEKAQERKEEIDSKIDRERERRVGVDELLWRLMQPALSV